MVILPPLCVFAGPVTHLTLRLRLRDTMCTGVFLLKSKDLPPLSISTGQSYSVLLISQMLQTTSCIICNDTGNGHLPPLCHIATTNYTQAESVKLENCCHATQRDHSPSQYRTSSPPPPPPQNRRRSSYLPPSRTHEFNPLPLTTPPIHAYLKATLEYTLSICNIDRVDKARCQIFLWSPSLSLSLSLY